MHGLDLDAAPGEIVGILGPNGAGKSTLLRLLATALAPSSGTLRLLGQPAVPPAAGLRGRIGFVQDHPVHLDALSGSENAIFFARAAGLDAFTARKETAGLLERFGLAADAHRPAADYSHGMRRKLLLTQGLAHAPELILLDEPTLGLDPPARAVLRDLLEERAAAGATIVFATHDVLEAQGLCGRVAFIHEGGIALEGSPAELLQRLGTSTWIEVNFDPGADEVRALELRLEGVELVHATPDRLEVRAAAGSSVLPALCATLVEANVAIRSIHLHEPDLNDLFREVTGSSPGTVSPDLDSREDPTLSPGARSRSGALLEGHLPASAGTHPPGRADGSSEGV